MLILNEKYRIKYEDNNVILQLYETRERKNKETKETTQYEYTSDFHYPNVKTALKKFLQLSLEGSESIREVLDRIEEVEQKINQICK